MADQHRPAKQHRCHGQHLAEGRRGPDEQFPHRRPDGPRDEHQQGSGVLGGEFGLRQHAGHGVPGREHSESGRYSNGRRHDLDRRRDVQRVGYGRQEPDARRRRGRGDRRLLAGTDGHGRRRGRAKRRDVPDQHRRQYGGCQWRDSDLDQLHGPRVGRWHGLSPVHPGGRGECRPGRGRQRLQRPRQRQADPQRPANQLRRYGQHLAEERGGPDE